MKIEIEIEIAINWSPKLRSGLKLQKAFSEIECESISKFLVSLRADLCYFVFRKKCGQARHRGNVKIRSFPSLKMGDDME